METAVDDVDWRDQVLRGTMGDRVDVISYSRVVLIVELVVLHG